MEPNKILLQPLCKTLLKLEKLDWAKRGFFMGYWAKLKKPKTQKLGCGTVCCAFGLGTTLPSWKKAGIRLVKELDTDTYMVKDPIEVRRILGLNGPAWNYIFCYSPEYLHDDGTAIDEKSISPGMVAARIDAVLNKEFQDSEV